MNQLRLKWKIFAFLLGFCALLLGFLWLFQTVFLSDMYKFIRKQELHRAMAQVEQDINNPALFTELARIHQEMDILVVPELDFVMPQHPGVIKGSPGRWNNGTPETITETRTFQLENGQSISLTFHALVAPVNTTISTLLSQLSIITCVMILLSVLLAILISKRVSRPLEDISRSARNLAKGNYHTRFEGKGFYEVAELSRTLNTAAVELGRAEGLRRELLANVSHDLRTPLALIYSYAELMHDFPDEYTPEQPQVIMEETQRLATLVNDVLDLSKLESNMEQCCPSRYSLTQSVLETTKRMEALLKKDGYALAFTYDSDVFVHADESKIGRAFYNLLINAVNYSGDSREITVAQTVSDRFVRISVTDSGEGITEEELPDIWDRYYKSGKAHKRAFTGTGLGLSIVKKVIEMHCGNYGVASAHGQGSTFWFELPLPPN